MKIQIRCFFGEKGEVALKGTENHVMYGNSALFFFLFP